MKSFLFRWIPGVFLIVCCTQSMANIPQLSSDSEESTAGYFQLRWHGDEGSNYLLQEAGNPDFSQASTLYEGPDTATLISGRSDGTYYYRVRYRDKFTDDGWSNVTRVEVGHHTLSRAFVFFSLGAIVFIATLVVVVIGNRRQS